MNKPVVFGTFVFLVLLSFGIGALSSGRAGMGSITGGITLVDNVSSAASAAIKTSHVYILLAVASLGAIAGTGYQRSKSTKIQRLVAKTHKHLKSGAFESAVQVYEETKLLYEGMDEEKKLKSYNDVIGVYNQLLSHYKTKEAQRLAEKYSKGTITQEELRKLEAILQG